MLKGGISDPRNKALMKMFNMIGIGERAGSGVPDIYAVWDAQGWIAPEVEEQYNPDRTLLTLSFEARKDANPEANDANCEANDAKVEKMIIRFLKENPKVTQKELAEKTGVSRATIQRTMKAMTDEQIISRVGFTRGYWHVIDKA